MPEQNLGHPIPGVEYLGPAITAAMFLLLLALEAGFPLRLRKFGVGRRILINICVSGLALAIGACVARFVSLNLAVWTSTRDFGILHIVELPFVVEFIVGFMLMDLAFYHWHRLNHVLPLLWRFHNVHHIDPDLDVSTSFRFHFAEVAYSAGFRAIQVTIIGVSPLIYVVYELIFQWATMFHHSNVRLPLRFERWLNKIFVTPRMHGIHHSAVRDETDANYSVIFRWWDILHRTLILNVRQSDINIGVPAYQRPGDNKLWHLFSLPFKRQRDYWVSPDGRQTTRGATDRPANARVMLE